MGGNAEYAPQALYRLFDEVKRLIPSAKMGGIQGDARHVYGYHRARNVLPASDYSVTEALDRQGDGWACSALDVTLPDASVMHAVSRRLLAAKHDKRMAPIREFFGSTDGRTVCGWDWSGNCSTTSDDMTHLWHVHLSVHRKYANDFAALRGVAEVMAGKDSSDVSLTVKQVTQAAKAAIVGPDGKRHRVDTVVWFMHRTKTKTDTGLVRNWTPIKYLQRAYANALTAAHRAAANGKAIAGNGRALASIVKVLDALGAAITAARKAQHADAEAHAAALAEVLAEVQAIKATGVVELRDVEVSGTLHAEVSK